MGVPGIRRRYALGADGYVREVQVSPSSAPTVIAGRYEIDGELGRGGMAEVRAGTDLRLRRPIAVKFLLPEMAAREDIRRRFEAEARTAASLSHPHAVAVFDTGEHEGLPYIVMERLPGETLADRIAAGPVDPDWLRGVVGEVLAALATAHAAGLVHRDVKPGNILLTADGHAKIADFGIAKSIEGSSDLTGTGQLLGTPAYLAPERIDGAEATSRSDLYSLGGVLYEALAGQCPFPGDTPLAAARAVMAGDHLPLDQARPGLDPDLVATVERAMATDPDRRFPSADAMAAALAGAGASRPAPTAAAGAPTLVDGAGGGSATAVLSRAQVGGVEMGEPPPVRRPRARVPLALIVVLAFVGLLVAGLNSRSPSTPEPSAASSAEPTTTAALSPLASLAGELRAAADRLSPTDGPRATELATRLRQVADQVPSGGGAVGATETMVAVSAWRQSGQISDAATVTAVTLLGRVPGVTTATVGASQTPTTVGRQTTVAPGNPGGRNKGRDKDDDD